MKALTAHGLTEDQKRKVAELTLFNIRTGFYATAKAARQAALKEIRKELAK